MLLCVSVPIRKAALDLRIFRKVPGFLKDPIGSLKKVVGDFIEKDPEKNLPAVLNFLKTSPDIKNAGNLAIPVLVLSAIIYLSALLGPGLAKILENKYKETEAVKTIQVKEDVVNKGPDSIVTQK